MRLDGKLAVVTGAARNIGREICLKFAKEGAHVVVNDCANLDEGRELVKEIEALGRKAFLAVADVSKPTEVAAMFDEIKKQCSRIDILVNNACVRPRIGFTDMEAETWERVIEVGLNGPFYCCKEAVPVMIKQKSGCIINISGKTGYLGAKGGVHIAAAKSGLHGFTKSLALELAEYGIRVNIVAPSKTDTSGSRKPIDPEVAAEYKKEQAMIPLGRLGRGRDIANACLFMASEEASFITGQTLHVNGGRY